MLMYAQLNDPLGPAPPDAKGSQYFHEGAHAEYFIRTLLRFPCGGHGLGSRRSMLYRMMKVLGKIDTPIRYYGTIKAVARGKTENGNERRHYTPLTTDSIVFCKTTGAHDKRIKLYGC